MNTSIVTRLFSTRLMGNTGNMCS